MDFNITWSFGKLIIQTLLYAVMYSVWDNSCWEHTQSMWGQQLSTVPIHLFHIPLFDLIQINTPEGRWPHWSWLERCWNLHYTCLNFIDFGCFLLGKSIFLFNLSIFSMNDLWNSSWVWMTTEWTTDSRITSCTHKYRVGWIAVVVAIDTSILNHWLYLWHLCRHQLWMSQMDNLLQSLFFDILLTSTNHQSQLGVLPRNKNT